MRVALRQDREDSEYAQAEESAWRHPGKVIIDITLRTHGYSGLIRA